MKIPLHSRLRREFRTLIYTALSKLTPKAKTDTFIDKNEIKSILIVRPNYRIGNIIFLTPLINELAKLMPEAKIDLIVGMKLAGKILEPMPNVERVIDIPRKLLLHPIELIKLIKKTRAKRYDLVLNISAGSVSSEIVTALANAKYKASFQNDKTFIRLTHTVKRENLYKHSGSRPLELLKLFNDGLPASDVLLDIKLSESERLQAKKELHELLKRSDISENVKVIALFRNARFDKKIPDAWWNEWHKALLELDKNIVVIDILSPDIPQKLNEQMLEYSSKDLRALGAFFHACDLYVSADTGPLHLASAADAKVLALFNKTDKATYGVLEAKSKTLDINGLTSDEVAKITLEML